MFDNTIIIPTCYMNMAMECVASLRPVTNLARTEVLIVANGCKEDAQKLVVELGPPFRLVLAPERLGFTRAVNVGIAASQGKRVVLLNDDCKVLDWGGNWIEMLEEPFKDPTVAATGSTRDMWAPNKPFLVFFCTMVRKDLLLRFGLLDECFNPGAGEDADFCLKAQQAGYRVVQVPKEFGCWRSEFPIWHVGHITCGTLPNWNDIAVRNTAILEARYPRTQGDRDFQLAFSKGLQNHDAWAKQAVAKTNP